MIEMKEEWRINLNFMITFEEDEFFMIHFEIWKLEEKT